MYIDNRDCAKRAYIRNIGVSDTRHNNRLRDYYYIVIDEKKSLVCRENGQIRAPVRNASKPPSSVDSRRLSVARPSSPPPPPPPSTTVKRHSTGKTPSLIYYFFFTIIIIIIIMLCVYQSVNDVRSMYISGNNAAYDGSLPRSISNSKGRPAATVLDKSNTTAVETVSENGNKITSKRNCQLYYYYYCYTVFVPTQFFVHRF